MKNKNNFVAAAMICVAAVWSPSALASPMRIGDLLNFMASQEDLRLPTRRLQLVQTANDYCADLEMQFPQNSPEEDAWLDREIKISGPRTARASNSPEFGRRLVKNFVTQCLQATSAYREGLKTSSSQLGQKNALIMLAYSMSQYGDGLSDAAAKNGLASRDWGLDGVRLMVPTVLLAAAWE